MERKWLYRLADSPLVHEGAPLLGLYWLYSTIRWFVARDTAYEAFQNAFTIIRVERELGLFHEIAVQSWLIHHAPLFVQIANAFYTLGYFPVIIACGVLLHRFKPQRFHVFKLTLLLGLGLALVCFSVFPLAPPRMLRGVGFIDTQQMFGDSLYHRKTVLSFYNPYAAMPSLHFGWTLLVGFMAYSLERRLFRIVGVLYPTLMALVVVTTGHHYVLDIVGGGIVFGAAYVLVRAAPQLATRPAIRLTLANRVPVDRNLPLHTRSSRNTAEQAVTHWSRQRQEYVQRENLRSTIIATLTIRKPPQ
jgi:hypothetical protein